MAEAAIVKAAQAELSERGAWSFKTTGVAVAGIPDIVGAYRGRPIALEVKQPGRYPTRLQRHELSRAIAAKAYAHVVRSRQDVKNILDQIDKDVAHDTT